VQGRGRPALNPPHSLQDRLGSTLGRANQALEESQKVDSRGHRATGILEQMWRLAAELMRPLGPQRSCVRHCLILAVPGLLRLPQDLVTLGHFEAS